MLIQATSPETRTCLIKATKRLLLVVLSSFIMLTINGCSDANSQSDSASSAPPPPSVNVDTITLTSVTDSAIFTGEFRSIDSVDLRPRVDGYIEKVFFNEGSTVEKGDLLFEIDPRPFKIALKRAEANVISAKAQHDLTIIELGRSEKLLATNAISKEIYDQNVTEEQIAKANYQEAKALQDNAQLNLDYTQITSPISGKISRAFITEGNFVNSGSTILTTVVSRNPMYVVFDADENNYINYVSQLSDNLTPENSNNTKIQVGFSGQDTFSYDAALDFIDNQVNPESGTIRIRATIDNPNGIFLPGMVARIKMQISDEYSAVLIDDSAIATDQSKKYVLVVNDQNTTEYRPVVPGGLYEGKRIIKSGLAIGDSVVIGGGLKIRPGMAVSPKEISNQNSDSLALTSSNAEH